MKIHGIDLRDMEAALKADCELIAKGETSVTDAFMLSLLNGNQCVHVHSRIEPQAEDLALVDSGRFALFGMLMVAKVLIQHGDLEPFADLMQEELMQFLTTLGNLGGGGEDAAGGGTVH